MIKHLVLISYLQNDDIKTFFRGNVYCKCMSSFIYHLDGRFLLFTITSIQLLSISLTRSVLLNDLFNMRIINCNVSN